MTRPDLSFAVNSLSRNQNCNKEAHWKSLKRVLRYLCSYDDRILIGYGDVYYVSDTLVRFRRSSSEFVFK